MYLLNLLSCQFLAFLPRAIRFDGLLRNYRPFLNQFSFVIISLLLMDFLLSLDEAALAICTSIVMLALRTMLVSNLRLKVPFTYLLTLRVLPCRFQRSRKAGILSEVT